LTNPSDLDPNGVIPVPDFSPGSLRILIERLEHSNRFQHYILRADELDAVGRHIDVALDSLPAGLDSAEEVARLERLRTAVAEANECVVSGSPRDAVERLRPFAV
jgi:hypothetical protein